MEGVIGEIRLFAGNFAPVGWAFCDGALLNIVAYENLFAIIGNTYGGNPNLTFRLPDLRGRIPVGAGQGPGLPTIGLGQKGGEETVTLTPNQMSKHTHISSIVAYGSTSSDSHPDGHYLGGGANIFTPDGTIVKMADNSVQLTVAGEGLPHNNLMPVLALCYIICTDGIYPSKP